ncbi:phosphoribosyltransferase [Rheinheimera texasensis]|uniref:phosphoribosyltransferase n=1 Tax=Rheinheimera texasensis TaxID=306205 RepID=UPI0032B2A573
MELILGIDVSGQKVVTFNPNHEYRLVTSPGRNPKISSSHGLKIQSIYRRTKDGDSARDGNPFIYALKSINGFSISLNELRKFKPSFDTILHSVLQGSQFTAVVPMPSSHPIAVILARRIARKAGCQLVPQLFMKNTVGNIVRSFNLANVKPKDLKGVKSQLATYNKLSPQIPVTLKEIDVKIRPYFAPLVINPQVTHIPNGNVLIVDDLISSGTTLRHAQSLLLSSGGQCSMAVCLLSSL